MTTPTHQHPSCYALHCNLDHDAIDVELRANPIGPRLLAECELPQYALVQAVIDRHEFHDHDCQLTTCLAMFVYNSAEMTQLLAEAYHRGRADAQH